METDERKQIAAITASLMLSDNLGDVHDQINRLHDLLNLLHPEGDYLDGWTDEDWRRLDNAR